VEVDETVFLALRLLAARQGASPSDLANALLRRALVAEIEEVSGVVPLASAIQRVVKAGGRTAWRCAAGTTAL
jgi:plasmid stability protein